MSGKHTPGPWGIDGNINIWIMAGHLHVATVPRAHDGDWSSANAKLIAAAPDLLEACKQATAILRGDGAPGWGVAKDILNTAIAKAASPTP